MREIDGRLVCESLAEVVQPIRAALLVVDVQNDYCTLGGALEREGGNIAMTGAVVAHVKALVDAARASRVPVVWIQQTWLERGVSDSPAWLYMKRRNGIRQERCIEGTWGHRFVDGLEPAPGEPIVRKHRSSGFIGTNLDLVLRSNRIETVIVVGVMSEGCVESTARDAAFHDYYVVLTPDAMASDVLAWHEASVLTMSGRHDMVPWRTLVQLWEGDLATTAPASSSSKGVPR